MDRRAQMVFPTPPRWLRNLLVGLLAVYVVELVLRNDGFQTTALAWHSFENGFAWYQIPLRFVVQGSGAFGVVLGLAVMYFLIPPLLQSVAEDLVRKALLAGAVGGTLLPVAMDVANLGNQSALVFGWSSLLVTIVSLFGLFMPEKPLYLMFFLPVPGKWLMIFTGIFCALGFVFGPSMASAEPLGVFIGTLGWFYGMGPGARKRKLRNKAAKLEKELKRFEVIDGGQSDSDGGNREWIN